MIGRLATGCGPFRSAVIVPIACIVAHAALAQQPPPAVAPMPPTTQPAAATPPAVVTPPATSGPFWIRINGDSVNLRSRPDLNSTAVARLDRGTMLRSVGMDGTWYRVMAPRGVFSLVKAEFVETRPDGRGTVKLDSGTLRVRVGSRTTPVEPERSDVQTLLERGTEVRITGRQGDWLEIVPPDGVFFFVASEFAERVSDESAGLAPGAEPPVAFSQGDPDRAVLSGGGSPASASTETTLRLPPTLATAFSGAGGGPTTTQPVEPLVRPDLSGPQGRKLVEIEERIFVESARPAVDRAWPPLIADLRPIAVQSEEPPVAQRATQWIRELEARQARDDKLRAERAALAQHAAATAPQPRSEPLEGKGAFEAVGVLMPSFALEAGSSGLRYQIVDPLSKRVLAYCEFPKEGDFKASNAVGKYVGVIGERYMDLKQEVQVIRVQSMTVLTFGPTETGAAQARPLR